jgi:hypothetical protein
VLAVNVRSTLVRADAAPIPQAATMLAKTIVENRMAELLDYGGKLAGGDLVVCTPSRISRPNQAHRLSSVS